ncbi:MAG: carboxypeptidase-like regulatory domain-containing protein [Patescibacteria group bacterium]
MKKLDSRGVMIIEVIVAIAVFVVFAIGVYEGIRYLYKIVFLSRLRIIETSILAERMEIIRNVPYASVGIVGGVPSGVFSHATTTVRNGINFTLTTYIRNVDDAYDGMATGTAVKDTSPADYKLVQLEIIAQNSIQAKAVSLTTIVAPKGLEGASNNGSLFINVFDANGLAVVGANVHVVNSSTNPATVIDDVTDNDGMLRIIDVPTGTQKYLIQVSKAGYSADYSVSTTASNPSPTKPYSTVVKQTVTDISFSIDLTGAISLNTIYDNCAIAPNISWNLRGAKKIGNSPIVYKNDVVYNSGSSAVNALSNVEWDTYYLLGTTTAYSVGGTIPISPFYLSPGQTQTAYVIIQPRTTNNLLVKILDNSTNLPISSSSIRLVGAGYDKTLITDLGYSAQTDWSGGSGQVDYSDTAKYASDDGNIDATLVAGDLKLKIAAGKYMPSGWLESSTFDLGSSVDFRNLVFTPISQPIQTGADSVLAQLATSNSSTPASWDYYGPDGTSATYYSPTSTEINSIHDGQRYMRYKIFLSTASTSYTPTFSELSVTYTNGCMPPGQVFFDDVASSTYTYTISRNGYLTVTGTVATGGQAELTARLIVN